jgi:nitrogen regulatory protein P-II 1
MKEIKAIIQPHMLTAVVRALHEPPHFPGLTVTEGAGQGRGRGAGGAYQPSADNIFFHRKTVVEIYCEDDAQAPGIAEIIHRAAHTGRKGDGIVVVRPIEALIRVRAHPEPSA